MFGQDADKIEIIKKHVSSFPDFPKRGVIFKDIFPILLQPTAHSLLREVILNFAKKVDPPIECVVAIDSRGFLIGPVLALDLNLPFVPIRKKGKLPGKIYSQKYDLEYGQDELQIQQSSIRKNMRVFIVDDLLASGGTLEASCKLIEKSGGNVVACFVIIELLELNGKSKVSKPVHSIIQY